MQYLQPSFTMPQAKPSAAHCCEACVFGSGEHHVECIVLMARRAELQAAVAASPSAAGELIMQHVTRDLYA